MNLPADSTAGQPMVQPCIRAATATPAQFEGKFLPAERSGRNGDLLGCGSITFMQDHIVLQGKAHRHFWSGRKVRCEIPERQIYNVIRHDRVITFQLEVPLGRQTELLFETSTEEQAEALLHALPTRCTEEFLQNLAEHNSFAMQLHQCSPHAWVTPVLVALNVLIFALMAASGVGFLSSDGRLALAWGTNFSPLTLGGQWWRLLTSMFIHFGILHLGFNMLALYSVGELVERLYGSIHFLVLYLVAGLAGSLASLIWNPIVNSAGASGAIFGVFGALLVYMLIPEHGVPCSLMQAHKKSIAACIVYNLVFGATVPGIDNAAHIGGLLSGMLMGLVLARPVSAERRFSLAALLRSSSAGMLLLALGIGWLLSLNR